MADQPTSREIQEQPQAETGAGLNLERMMQTQLVELDQEIARVRAEQGAEGSEDETDPVADQLRAIEQITGVAITDKESIQAKIEGEAAQKGAMADQIMQRLEHRRVALEEAIKGWRELAEKVEQGELATKLAEFNVAEMDPACEHSFIVPTYADGKKIESTLASLLDLQDTQGKPLASENVEAIILVCQNDGATQEERDLNKETLATITEFFKKDPKHQSLKVRTLFKSVNRDELPEGDLREQTVKHVAEIGQGLVDLRNYNRSLAAQSYREVQTKVVQPGEVIQI